MPTLIVTDIQILPPLPPFLPPFFTAADTIYAKAEVACDGRVCL